MKKLLKIFLVIIFFGLWTMDYGLSTIYAQHEGHQPEQAKEQAKAKQSAKQKDIYYCPMHPSYISDRPGDCPICNMKLVKKEEAQAIEKAVKEPKDICILHNCPMLGEGKSCLMLISGNIKDCSYCGAHLTADKKGEGFYVSPEKQQLIGVKTDKVIYRPLAKIIRTVGRVAFDPELYKAQAEYIEALKTQEKIKGSTDKVVVERAEALAEAAKFKLELSGLGREQIEELARTKEKDNSLLISYADYSFTWVYATIYEYELEYIKTGIEAKIKAVSYPDKEFKGTVVAVDPVFDTMTRSVRARIKADNKDGLLKPNMYVDVEIASDLGERLAVPKEAVMDTGLRKVVFVSSSTGYFQGREVKTGVSVDDYVEIVEGLKEGESVVTSGNFLIDSESKLKAALEGTGHQH
ncbi:MAG: efflux RND transporter periplasmic adaptor subunit [Candidatus Omnitrophota bacterium]